MSLLDEARTVRQRILTRLQELEPLVEEYNELKQIADEMGLDLARGAGGSAQGRARASRAGRRRTAPARGRSRSATGRGAAEPGADIETGARGTADGGATASSVADRVLEAVRAEPGKTVGDYAEILGVAATALYRPVRELTNDGVLVKRARQLFPA